MTTHPDHQRRVEEILREVRNATGYYSRTLSVEEYEKRLCPFAERLARAESEPQGIELVKELRDALGLDNGARPDSPREVWQETLAYVRRLRAEHYRPTMPARPSPR